MSKKKRMKVAIINAYWHTRSPYLNFVLEYENSNHIYYINQFYCPTTKIQKIITVTVVKQR